MMLHALQAASAPKAVYTSRSTVRNTRVKWPCLAVIWEARRDHEALVFS